MDLNIVQINLRKSTVSLTELNRVFGVPRVPYKEKETNSTQDRVGLGADVHPGVDAEPQLLVGDLAEDRLQRQSMADRTIVDNFNRNNNDTQGTVPVNPLTMGNLAETHHET